MTAFDSILTDYDGQSLLADIQNVLGMQRQLGETKNEYVDRLCAPEFQPNSLSKPVSPYQYSQSKLARLSANGQIFAGRIPLQPNQFGMLMCPVDEQSGIVSQDFLFCNFPNASLEELMDASGLDIVYGEGTRRIFQLMGYQLRDEIEGRFSSQH